MVEVEIDHASVVAEIDRLTRGVLRVAGETVADATKALERDLEAATRTAVGGRLWRAWSSEVFPTRGRIARSPAGNVFVNGGLRSQGAMEFHTRAGRIRGSYGQYLAIPLPAAGSRGRLRDLTPGEWERKTGIRLRFVYRPRRASLLVADMGTTNRGTGRFRKITRQRTAADERRGFVRGEQTVPIFVLVATVPFANDVAVEPLVDRARRSMHDNFSKRMGEIG